MSVEWKTTYSVEEIEPVDCPLCSSSSFCKLAEEWSLGIVRCSVCDLIYVNPRVKDPEKNYWGEEEKALRKYDPIFNDRQPHDRDRNYREHLKVIQAIKSRGKLLDVGTHCGFFLRMARNQGWELYGIEPSLTNAKLAREKFGLNVLPTYLEDGVFPPEFFDIVTLVDMLEHVTTPRKLLSVIRGILKPDGILFIKVPNARWNLLKYQILNKFLKLKHVDIFDSREHVVHYSQDSLTKMLDKEGFMVKKFYVPSPIQTGESWKKSARSMAFTLARSQFLATGRLGPFVTDLACVAEKVVY
jgi:2-polyprenyl-3-methyl-5-hydroxy-6-metoxy-1,4-benzoquinol methylase